MLIYDNISELETQKYYILHLELWLQEAENGRRDDSSNSSSIDAEDGD